MKAVPVGEELMARVSRGNFRKPVDCQIDEDLALCMPVSAAVRYRVGQHAIRFRILPAGCCTMGSWTGDVLPSNDSMAFGIDRLHATHAVE
jgi:hypothetical protein